MAIPVLYWMLECAECGSRLVAHDSYLKFVGTSDPASGHPSRARRNCCNTQR